MSRIYQEFYCSLSGGGCGGYITVRLNASLNGVIEVVCPKCGHKHRRMLKDGVLHESGRYSSDPTQELLPTLAAWSARPKYPESQRSEIDGRNERIAQVIDESSSKKRSFLCDLWFERFGGKGV